MDDNSKLPKQAKPQEFELVELLFQEYIQHNIASPNIEYSFQARFQSFINQIPSYLHSSNKVGFFTHFFFGAFTTLLDTELSKKIGINKLNYNFDQANILRVVAETDGKTYVFIFAENSSKNNKQQQNKNKDLEFTKGEWKTLKGREYTDADKDNLEISVIKVNKSKGSIKVIVENQDIKDVVDSIKQYHEVIQQCVDDNTEQYVYLEDEVSKFSSSKAEKQADTLKFILKYIKKIHDHYQGLPYGDMAQEADEHGFVAGIFNNFRYRENAHVYLEQFAGKGYADIVLLVRGAERSTKSIPIIIELKAGFGSGTTSSEALAQVTEYSKGFQPNNMRILTIPDNILCVGMNLDHDANSFMQMKLVQRDQEMIPLMQGIIDAVKKSKVNNNDVITQEIKHQLENTYQTFPGVGEKSSAHYFSRFLLGESIVLQDYDKHIFVYNDEEYIATKTVINQHATRSQGGSTAKQQKVEKIVDSSNAVTSMLFLPIRNSKDPGIIVNIIDANREVILKNIPLDNALIGNRKIVELNIKFNIHNSNKSFEEYCDIELLQVYSSIVEYNKIKGSEKVNGDFKVVDAEVADNVIDNISNAIDSQRGLIIAESRYKELFKKLGEILSPLKSLVNNEAEFQGILEGVFKYYSDIKLNERSDRRELVLTEFQTGGGGRIDMLIQAIGASEQGTKEYMPVGFELKYDDSVKLNSFDRQQDGDIQRLILGHKEQVLVHKLLNEQAERYSHGAAIKAITDSNKVAIMGIVFNAQAKDAGDLLLTTDKFLEANIVHSSKLYSVSSNVNAINAQDSLKPDAEYFRPDWVEQETYDLVAKSLGEDNSILHLSNSALNDQIVKKLVDLLKSEVQIGQYIDGLDLSFNTVTASSVQELIKKFSKLVYLDLSDNDLANNHLIDLEEMIKEIQVPILKIADIGMNDQKMRRVVESLKERDKISDLEITHLDDANLVMSSGTASVIAQYLRSTKNLNYLNLANNKIQDTAISLIVQGLVGQTTVSSLVLTKNGIGVAGVQKLANVLKDTVISHIDLSGNPLGVGGVSAIVEGIRGGDNVKSIELVNVDLKYDRENIEESGELLSSIKSLFKNKHLTRINIANNDIGNGGLAKIFEILSKRIEKSNLEDLSLAGNKIDWGSHPIKTETLKALIYNFLSQNKKIRSLDLSLMEIDDEIGERIASALEKNVSLVHLDLSGNDRIGSKAVGGLANVLKTHQYLKYLNLSNNKLTITDLEVILGSLKTNEVVSHINLSGNDFSGIITDVNGQKIIDLNNQYIDFANLLSGNRELQHLNLANCQLNEGSILSLCKAIENNIAMEVLDIRGNKIASSIIDRIVDSLNKNANQGLDIGLKILHVSKGDLEGSAISKLADKSLGIAVLVDGIDVLNASAEERLKQTSYTINLLDKQSTAALDRDHQTFESNTISGQYHYWLQAHDILDIARVHYGYGEERPIEIVGSIGKLSTQLGRYLANSNNAQPLTMILNIGADGVGGDHWVSLVLHNRGNEYHGYYVDSFGNNIEGNIASILSQHRIMIHDLSNQQQRDGHNCGLWALENARIVHSLFESNGAVDNVDIIRNSLIRSRTEQEFKEIRDNILQELMVDSQRRENLRNLDIEMSGGDDNLYRQQQESVILSCLPGSRGKRSINECKIGWEDIDKFNLAKQEERRDIRKINIDSEKFLSDLSNVKDNDKRDQLVRFIDEIRSLASDNQEQMSGRFQGLVNNLINDHRVISHLEKVGRISGMTMHGMMAKSALVDFLHGDYKGVAINIGFIAGGQGLVRLSEIVSLKGLKLVSGGELILGRTLGAAAPFLARGTSSFVVYDLVKQVKELKAGNKDALVGVVGDSIYLTIDVAEVGVELAEVFGALEGFSSITGPIGAVIGAIVFVGTDIYFAVRKVDEIDQVIHLSGWEKFKEGWRAFLGMNPEGYIKELMDSKQVNNQLVKQKLEYLKQHPEIQRYVFPTGESVIDTCHEVTKTEVKSVCSRAAYLPICVNKHVQTRHEECSTKIQEDLNNTVLLDRKREDIKWSRSKPDTPSGGKIFCYPEGDYEKVARDGGYKCKNAIGITDSVMKSGNYTFIGLGQGDDQVIGFSDSPHIFLVGDGYKRYIGGNKDELFILAGSYITGTLDGKVGIDTIELLEESFSGYNMILHIDLTVGRYGDNYGYIAPGHNVTGLYIQQIEHIIGRAKAEVINWHRGSYIIESKGGWDNQPDNIILQEGQKEDKVTLVIDRSTNVFNKALKGYFYYKINKGSVLVDLSYSNLFGTNHTFYLDYGIVDIQDIAIESSISFGKNISTIRFNVRGDNSSIYIKYTDVDLRKMIYHFKDSTEVTVSGKDLYSIQDSDESIEKIMQEYPVIAHRLGIFMVVRSTVNNETVSIGNGEHEVIYNDAFRKSHLIGGAGEDIYVITSGHRRLNSSDELKMPEITIYNVNGLNQTDTIDLRQLSKQVAIDLDSTLIESIRKDENDIVIELFMSGNDVQEIRYVTTIRLKDAIENKWYERLQVILDSAVKKINYSNDKFALISEPIVFGNDIEVIVIGERDIDWQTELVIQKKIGQYSFYYVKDDANHGNKDLVITNMFDSSVGKENWCSVLLSNFYNTVDKMQTVHIKFADKEMTLKDELTEINKAREYIDQLGQYRSKIYSAIFDQLDSHMMNSTSCTLADHHLSRRELSKELDKEIGKLDIQTLKAVKYLLLNGGELYDSTGVHKSLGFNSMEEQSAFIKEYEDYSVEEIKNDISSKEDHAGKAVILLLSKSYNELLCVYANMEETEVRKKIDKCFEYILSKRDIHRVVKQVYEEGAMNKLLKFMDNHQQEIQERIESKDMEYWSDDMSSEYDEAIYDRQRREVKQEEEHVSSKSNRAEPLGYNMVNWIKGAVLKLTGINPIDQVKKNVRLNVDDAQEAMMLNNDVDAMNNELYQDRDLGYSCALTNNIVDSSKLLEEGYKVEQLVNGCVANGGTTILKEVNYDLLDRQGNLLLLDVLMRKKSGVKYKCQQDQKVVSSNNLDSEYAQSLVYRGYVTKDKLSSELNNNMACMVGEDIDDIGLVGVN